MPQDSKNTEKDLEVKSNTSQWRKFNMSGCAALITNHGISDGIGKSLGRVGNFGTGKSGTSKDGK